MIRRFRYGYWCGVFSLVLQLSTWGAITEYLGPHDTHYAIPDNWEAVTADQRTVTLVHAILPATLSISARVFPEGITVNRLQDMHMIGNYDGWISIGTEAGTLFDNQRANTTESFKAIYGKTQLNEALEPVRDFVIDYYFVKDTIGYIVSIQTPQSHWQQLKPDIQFFLKYFWIGPDSKQTIVDKTPYLWPTAGKTSGHTRYFPIHVSPVDTATPNWMVQNPPDGLITPPIIGTDWYAFTQSNQLVVGDLKTGTINWTMRIPRGIVSQLATHQNLLFFVTGSDPNILIGVDPNSQQVVIHTPLGEPLGSPDITIHKNQILLQLFTSLVAIDAHTGQWLWDYPNTSSLPPTATDHSLILMSENKQLLQLDTTNQTIVHEWPIPSSINPIAHSNHLWAAHYTDNTLYVTVLDTQTGEVLTQLNQTTGRIQQVWPAALSQHHYGVLFNDDTGMHYLWIIDTRTRETSGFILIDTPVQSSHLIGSPDTFEIMCKTDTNSQIRSIQVNTNTQRRRSLPMSLNIPAHHVLYGRFGSHFIVGHDDQFLNILSLP